MLDRIALILVIIGGINWVQSDFSSLILSDGYAAVKMQFISRIIYTLVALAAVWCISLLFKQNEILSSDNGEKRA